MAKRHPQNDFLSGLKFNSVGGGVSETESPTPSAPSLRRSWTTARTLVILLVLVLLASVLYLVNDFGGSITHTTSHGVSPKPIAPP